MHSTPKAADTLRSQLQLMLYKRLLDALLQPSSPLAMPPVSNPPKRSVLSGVWTHVSVNPRKSFSSQFVEGSGALALEHKLGQEAHQATCLRDLEKVWQTMVRELGAGAITGEDRGRGPVSKTLELVYRLRGGGEASGFNQPSVGSNGSDEGVIDTLKFEYDYALLDNHLRDVLDFWHGRRPPRGVAIENVGRCT